MMISRPQTTPVTPRESDDSLADTVVWPDPSPLTAWWQQVMQTPAEQTVPPAAG
ncbi:hypothetical protein [Nocardia sp. BMG111209]|uniref:hypothetical protein n=1 Tax=Nocardia sp. BMG111209 TaxID=1160137 RepID=UPI0012DC8512|nr:hypothetical protein [Nocardia sp. BMG111209]